VTPPVLVTGGAGFVGSALVRALVGGGTPVVNLDKLTYSGDLASLASLEGDARHTFVRGDIADKALVGDLLALHRPSGILHLAAESHVDRSIDGPEVFALTNALGTVALLDAARAHVERLPADERDRFRFLYVSTDEVYGSLGATGAFTEDRALQPSSPYAASKAAGDLFAGAWHRTYGLPILVSHGSNTYGPWQFPEKLIPTVVLAAIEGRPIPVYGEGSNTRDWIFVGDHVDALLRIFARGQPGRTYNVGGGAERTNLALVKAICALLDRLAPDPGGRHERAITFVPDRPGHDLRYAIDGTRMATELEWRPARTLEDGLAETVAWYLHERPWWERIRREVYDGRRLGLGVVA
jgi:dTDP-glucose 4,6-dehydratase